MINSKTVLEYLKDNIKSVIAIVIMIVIIVILVILSYNLYSTVQERNKTIQLTNDQLKDTRTVSDSLKVSPNDAVKIQREIYTIQSSNTPPSVSYTIESPDIQSAADKVQNQIYTNDKSAPSALTEKSDRTIINPNTDKQTVDVYKINLNKNHKVKAGMSYIDNKVYASVGYQAGKVEGVIHLDSKLSPKGGTIMYTLKEW